MATRCELSLMRKVVPVYNDEGISPMTDYLLRAIGKENSKEISEGMFNNCINKYSKKGLEHHVDYLVCNITHGMPTITYLLRCEDKTYYPAPFEEDYETGFPCAFCYTYNVWEEMFSELGDCFFEKRTDGCYHRAS